MAGVSTFVVGHGPTSFPGAALLPFAQSLEVVLLLWASSLPLQERAVWPCTSHLPSLDLLPRQQMRRIRVMIARIALSSSPGTIHQFPRGANRLRF